MNAQIVVTRPDEREAAGARASERVARPSPPYF